ncbi:MULTISPECIES: hypothetical protein [Methylotenera]|uniref:hypothetical protein n=1 Tax=Methylotenera TaxID=359407 RepID=UPI001E5429F8|nr:MULTISPECIES: hypothetical protein [Methylotenera]
MGASSLGIAADEKLTEKKPQSSQENKTEAQKKETATPAQTTPAQTRRPREKSFPKIASGSWTGSRLADGQPDISGFWSNTIGNHGNLTDPQGGVIGEARRTPLGPREERAPSRVSDPADGQFPFQPWALAKVKEFQVGFHNPTNPAHVEPNARCAPGGIPKSLYWHGYDILQYPGYVLFVFDNGSRIIHLDKNKPHLPEKLKLWNGDSRGHWEGNTLVVDVSNHNGKALFGRSGEFVSESATIKEKYIFANDGSRYNYEGTFTDPTVYTRPFTITIPAIKYTREEETDGWNLEARWAKHTGKTQILEHDERICHENNGGFGLGATPK